MYLSNIPATNRMRQKSQLIWMQCFRFPNKAKELLQLAHSCRDKNRFIPFLMALARSEMQTASSGIWIRVTESISNDDNCYTMHASQYLDEV